MEESYGLQDYSREGDRVDAVDPVCGAVVNQDSAHETAEYAGEKFYCCSADCRVKFEEEPGIYIGQRH
jgi:Cu+-exporting ATPase